MSERTHFGFEQVPVEDKALRLVAGALDGFALGVDHDTGA